MTQVQERPEPWQLDPGILGHRNPPIGCAEDGEQCDGKDIHQFMPPVDSAGIGQRVKGAENHRGRLSIHAKLLVKFTKLERTREASRTKH